MRPPVDGFRRYRTAGILERSYLRGDDRSESRVRIAASGIDIVDDKQTDTLESVN